MDFSDLKRVLDDTLKQNDNPNALKPISPLLNCIEGIPELKIFNGLMQILPRSAFRFDYGNLASWLINHSKKTTIDQTIEHLQQYIDSNEIPSQFVSVVMGLKVTKKCIIDDKIKIVPWNELNHSEKKEMAEKHLKNRFFPGVVNKLSCIIHNFAFKKYHATQDFKNSNPFQGIPCNHQEIIHCAGLFGPIAPTIMVDYILFPDWMPTVGIDYGLFHSWETPSEYEWPEKAYEDFPKLYDKYKTLPSSAKEKIKIPLYRLNSAMKGQTIIDQAIDSGIALEALFLSDLSKNERGELNFKLKTRGSRYLRSSFDDRKKTYKLIGDLYEIRSQAIHSGRLKENTNKEPTGILIRKGYELIAETLIKIINEGKIPEWDQVLLS